MPFLVLISYFDFQLVCSCSHRLLCFFDFTSTCRHPLAMCLLCCLPSFKVRWSQRRRPQHRVVSHAIWHWIFDAMACGLADIALQLVLDPNILTMARFPTFRPPLGRLLFICAIPTTPLRSAGYCRSFEEPRYLHSTSCVDS
ncbi:hypothetical protein GE09DRAFT_718764 [Coniochaeta sp. 2T2.1]|nr:hypothetical protein GE09DRAFT_718764 [Coniochaeta sp. 2T2.1]